MRVFTLSGVLVGPIWWPVGALCTKDAVLRFVHNESDAGPWLPYFETLRDALLKITNDGDFQHCVLALATLTVDSQRGSYQVSRTFELRGADGNSDMYASTEEETEAALAGGVD